MELEFGSIKRFSDFVGSLGEKDKIALISHLDCDGLVAGKVVNEVIDADFVKFVNYDELNDGLIEELKKNGVNRIILSDLTIDHSEFLKGLESFAEILILDHHPPIEDWNSSRTTYIKVRDGYCAAYLCYELFRKMQDIERLDWLVACACISDFCYLKNSDWMKQIFEKYGDSFEVKDGLVRRNGKFWDLQWTIVLGLIYLKNDLHTAFESLGNAFGDLGDLVNYSEIVQKEFLLALERFEEEKEEFDHGYVWKYKPTKFKVGFLIANEVSIRYSDKTILIINEKEDGYSVSARRQDGGMDCGSFLREKMKGFENSGAGGHVKAAGGHFMLKDYSVFRKRLGLD